MMVVSICIGYFLEKKWRLVLLIKLVCIVCLDSFCVRSWDVFLNKMY